MPSRMFFFLKKADDDSGEEADKDINDGRWNRKHLPMISSIMLLWQLKTAEDINKQKMTRLESP